MAVYLARRSLRFSKDFTYIVAPINRVTGQEVRAVEYMHWWTFLLAYYEIGDCTLRLFSVQNIIIKKPIPLCGVPLLGELCDILRFLFNFDFERCQSYYEIGDCTFAQIVRIRDLRARGKPLDKTDAGLPVFGRVLGQTVVALFHVLLHAVVHLVDDGEDEVLNAASGGGETA